MLSEFLGQGRDFPFDCLVHAPRSPGGPRLTWGFEVLLDNSEEPIDSLLAHRNRPHDRRSESLGEPVVVDIEAGVFGHVDHVEGDHAGHAEIENLTGQIQVAFEVAGIDDDDDEVGFGRVFDLSDQHVVRDLLVVAACHERVTTGKVDATNAASRWQRNDAEAPLDGYAGVVPHFLA